MMDHNVRIDATVGLGDYLVCKLAQELGSGSNQELSPQAEKAQLNADRPRYSVLPVRSASSPPRRTQHMTKTAATAYKCPSAIRAAVLVPEP